MLHPMITSMAATWRELGNSTKRMMAVIRARGPNQMQFWFLALILGVLAGGAAVLFRQGIASLQAFLYQTQDLDRLASFATSMPWYWVVVLPALGGLVVGLILNATTPDGCVRSVADVIEGAALNNGRVERRAGLGSALASLITLSSGGSSGREGPVVHLAGVISTFVANRIHADGVTGRELLGCAVAGAVSASFNAPLAGALFALEVVLRHYAVHAFAPIAIASVAGTVVSRLAFGDVTEFTLPAAGLDFYAELPAFMILGLVCGLVAVSLIKAVFFTERAGDRVMRLIGLPTPFRPMVAGFLLGLIALVFPHIIGVGYETTTAALTGKLLLWQAILFTGVKVVAVAITIGGRMGGGVFSPSLMVGAMTGLAFGLVATSIFPDSSGAETLYALAGMGAVAAAVLGAPVSTTLIVFELTGDWQTGLAVMVAVSLSTALSSRLVDHSFFLTQLERRKLHLAAGPQAYLLAMFRVRQSMRAPDAKRFPSEDDALAAIDQGLYLTPEDTLETALPIFDEGMHVYIPVISSLDATRLRAAAAEDADWRPTLIGALYQVDALRTYNRALAAAAAEKHG